MEVISSLRYGQEEIKSQVETLVDPFIGKSVTWISNNPDLLETILRNRTIFLSDDNKQDRTAFACHRLHRIDTKIRRSLRRQNRTTAN